MKEKAVDVFVSEFDSLRNEIFSRFEFQRQAFNYLMALFAALITIAAADTSTPIDVRYALFIPFISCPLAYIFFDNEIMIWSIGNYINHELRPKLSVLVEEEVLMLEEKKGKYLSNSTSILHMLLSTGRWVLFLIPSVVPIIFALDEKWMQDSIYFTTAFIFDVILLIIMVWGAISAFIKRLDSWRSTDK